MDDRGAALGLLPVFLPAQSGQVEKGVGQVGVVKAAGAGRFTGSAAGQAPGGRAR